LPLWLRRLSAPVEMSLPPAVSAGRWSMVEHGEHDDGDLADLLGHAQPVQVVFGLGSSRHIPQECPMIWCGR
jgi:hypothetical protein